MKDQHVSRRRFIGSGMLAVAGIALAKTSFASHAIFAADKPNSVINGVQIGVITYSFRSMPGSAEQLLQYCIQCNISAIELMGGFASRRCQNSVAIRMTTLPSWADHQFWWLPHRRFRCLIRYSLPDFLKVGLNIGFLTGGAVAVAASFWTVSETDCSTVNAFTL